MPHVNLDSPIGFTEEEFNEVLDFFKMKGITYTFDLTSKFITKELNKDEQRDVQEG